MWKFGNVTKIGNVKLVVGPRLPFIGLFLGTDVNWNTPYVPVCRCGWIQAFSMCLF